MLRRLLWCAVAALAVIPTAAASGPSAGVTQGSDGLASLEGTVRYAAQPAGPGTDLSAIRISDGRVLRTVSLAASWGIPLVAFDGTPDGLSADGATLVLGSASLQTTPLR